MILYHMHDIVIYHACFVNHWHEMDSMIYCLNTVYAGVFFVMKYLDEKVHD